MALSRRLVRLVGSKKNMEYVTLLLRLANFISPFLIQKITIHRHELCEFQSKILPCLLKFRAGTDPALRDCSREALALVGYVDPVCNRGVRILCLDGGGTR